MKSEIHLNTLRNELIRDILKPSTSKKKCSCGYIRKKYKLQNSKFWISNSNQRKSTNLTTNQIKSTEDYFKSDYEMFDAQSFLTAEEVRKKFNIFKPIF